MERKVCLFLLALMFLTLPAEAHLKDYLVAYNYWTLPIDKVELEFPDHYKDSGSNSDAMEARLILSRDLRNGMNITVNCTAEKEREPGTAWELGYTAGACKRINHKLTLGLEVKGEEKELYLIPGAYMDVAKGARLNIGPAFCLTDDSTSIELQSVMEYEF